MKIEGLFTLAQAKRALEQERVNAPQRIHTLCPAGLRMQADPQMDESLAAYALKLPVLMYEVHQFVDVSEVPEEHVIVSAPPYTRSVALMFDVMLGQQREAFEAAMFDLFERNKLSVPLDDHGDGTREALFWCTETGLYGVRQFNAAWYGWLAARGIET